MTPADRDTLRARLAAAAADGIGPALAIAGPTPETRLRRLLDRIGEIVMPRRIRIAGAGGTQVDLTISNRRIGADGRDADRLAAALRDLCLQGGPLTLRLAPLDDEPDPAAAVPVAALRAAAGLTGDAPADPAARLSGFVEALTRAYPDAARLALRDGDSPDGAPAPFRGDGLLAATDARGCHLEAASGPLRLSGTVAGAATEADLAGIVALWNDHVG